MYFTDDHMTESNGAMSTPRLKSAKMRRCIITQCALSYAPYMH